MRIVKPSAVLLSITPDAAALIERVARVCYKSEDKIGPGTAAKMIDMLMKNGHMAMLEHASASILFVCDRGVTHEIVRHRLASFAQESTRYCNYGGGKFGGEITVVEPPGLANRGSDIAWTQHCFRAEEDYLEMLECGMTPQIARSVLPTCLKAEIVMTANFREWLHFLRLRMSHKAHPQMQEVASMAWGLLRDACPEVFWSVVVNES